MKKLLLVVIFFLAIPAHAAFPTQSAGLVAASSQYFSRANTGSTGLGGSATDFTFEAWVKFTTDVSASEMDFASKWGASNSYLIRYYDLAGVKALLSTSGATGVGVTISRFTPGTWYHIAYVYTLATQTQEIFINGVSQGSAAASGLVTPGTDAFLLGQQSGGSAFFNGRMVLARFWTTARTGTQLLASRCTTLGSTAGLSAEWTLDNVLTDNSGNSNTLTAVNSPTFSADVPAVCVPKLPVTTSTVIINKSKTVITGSKVVIP